MLGFSDLAGSEPCPRCGSDSGDCGWVRDGGRCSAGCEACRGTNVGRCLYCAEVVPCGMEVGRNPRGDALCAWRELAAVHGDGCPWTRTRGGVTDPLPAAVAPLKS